MLASGVHPGVRVGASYAIRSDRNDDRWYVGVEMYHVPRGELEVATWLVTGSKSNPATVLSADSAAQALSIWPSPQTRGAVAADNAEVRALVTALKQQ